MNTTLLARILGEHVANTITYGSRDSVLIDCLCGAEIPGVMLDRYDSTVGALMAVMAPHLANVVANNPQIND